MNISSTSLARFTGSTAGIVIEQANEDTKCIIGSNAYVIQGSILTLSAKITAAYFVIDAYYLFLPLSLILQYVGARRFRAGIDRKRQAAYDRRLVADVRRFADRAMGGTGEQFLYKKKSPASFF